MLSRRPADVARDALGSIYLRLPWRLQDRVPQLRVGHARWRVVAVEDLPYPHDLFKCAWRDIHRAAIAAHEAGPDGRQRAFDAFLSEIGDEGVARCPYHEIDWALAADFVCNQFSGGVYDSERIDKAAQAAGLDDKQREGIWEFFKEPVWISGRQLGNGQHRSCAMRASGGARCPIER